ncbi:hypothetical protein D3C77_689130 [compost metagenome]
MRLSKATPISATSRPTPMESSMLSADDRLMPTCLRPLLKVMIETMKPVRNMYTGT